MSQWEKLLSRILSMDKNLRFQELQKVLESYGYTMTVPKGGSSHFTFRKKGKMSITVPKNEPIKRVYIEMVKSVVEEENDNERS